MAGPRRRTHVGLGVGQPPTQRVPSATTQPDVDTEAVSGPSVAPIGGTVSVGCPPPAGVVTERPGTVTPTPGTDTVTPGSELCGCGTAVGPAPPPGAWVAAVDGTTSGGRAAVGLAPAAPPAPPAGAA